MNSEAVGSRLSGVGHPSMPEAIWTLLAHNYPWRITHGESSADKAVGEVLGLRPER